MLKSLNGVVYGLAADGSGRWAISSPTANGEWLHKEKPDLFYNVVTHEAFDKTINDRQRNLGQRFLYPAIFEAEAKVKGQLGLFEQAA